MTGASILVVEDHPLTAMHESALLRDLGYAVTGIVFTGEDAISRAGEDGPDVVLMDIRLIGDIDGIQAAREIRNRYGTPVVFVTAGVVREQPGSALPPVGYGLVIKPFTRADLATAIESVLPRAQFSMTR